VAFFFSGYGINVTDPRQ